MMKNLIRKILRENDEFGWIKDIQPLITIGNPKTQSNPKHKIKIVFDFMHGDADSYSDEAILIDGDDTNRLRALLDLYELTDKYFNDDDLTPLTDAIKNSGDLISRLDWEEEELEDYLMDSGVVAYDVHYDGYTAGNISEVTYFDHSGIEHEAKITKT